MKKRKLNMFQIATAYIGTVVGAGFASGQEVLQFFNAYGLWGLWGILVSSLLFFFVGYSILMLGRNLNARSHVDIVRHTNGDLLGTLIDIVITVFMFGGLAAMLAGSGAICGEQFGIAPVWGVALMAAAALVTVATGTQSVVSAMSYIVPFLIFSVLYISFVSLMRNPVTQEEISAAAQLGGATPHWLLSAVNYASYNIVVSIGVLAAMGAGASRKRTLLGGAVLGALGLGLGMAAIYLCVMTNIGRAYGMEVPMIAAASAISPFVRLLFSLVLFGAVYTTAVGNLFGLVQRLSYRLPHWMFAAAATALAFAAAQFGFSSMVKFLYPAVGYGGMLFFGGMAYVWIKKRNFVR